ncbi:hypothetical protein DIZ76_014997 [Coccidioides immitis]|nr:hypothetical protein DIZ76_014997 [Coccidioides immitis]
MFENPSPLLFCTRSTDEIISRFSLRHALCRAVCAPYSQLAKSRTITTIPHRSTKLDRIITAATFQQRWLSGKVQSEQLNTPLPYTQEQQKKENGTPSEESSFAISSGSLSGDSSRVNATQTTSDELDSAKATETPVDSRSVGQPRFSIRRPKPDGYIAPKSTIYVGNLFFDVTAGDLKNEFSKCGPVEGVRLLYDYRGVSKGFGYVKFHDVETAEKAVALMHGQLFEGRHLAVNFARVELDKPMNHDPTKPPTRTLYIGNIPFEMTDRDLNELFKDVDNIIDVRVAVDRRTGRARGFVHADFTDIESARKAFTLLSTKTPYGRPLRIDYSHSNIKIQPAGPPKRDDPGATFGSD